MGWPKGKPRSAETRAKMSAAQRGKTHTPEARAKISAAQRGKVVSPETRAKMSAAQRGKVVSPETRAKMSAAQRMDVPSADRAAVVAAYATAGLAEVSERVGYARRVIRRVLVEAGVAIRPRGVMAARVSSASGPEVQSSQSSVSTHAPEHEETRP